MNRRLKELAEQAETKEIGYYFFDREKFATLIVKECALIAGLMEHEGRKNIGATILDRFEIERE